MAIFSDFLSLTKPKITLLNIGSAISCYILAGGSFWGTAPLFLTGYLASGGSSMLNNYLDRDIDGLMRRTAKRPLPSGRVPGGLVLTLGLVLSVASIVLAWVLFNPLTALMIAAGILAYVVVYTILLKRRTDWNIVIGGAAGSFPPLAGWAAATNTIGLEALLMALLIFLWTPGHFWALAIRAENDYRSARLPMLPVTKGLDQAVTAIAASNMMMLGSWVLLSLTINPPTVFLLVTAPLTVLIAYYTAALIKNRSRDDSWRLFKATSPWLLIIQLGLILVRIV
ncbi:Protoheme IX farnesyltransferase [Candidatus Calditenuaceae archaeon HR02]|nr:Protoheme IX farnesyltransferase [Candidatus Calditenuaceae archaeon HR02]